jgi:hypothetical protein
MLVSDLITAAFEDVGFIQVGETITPAIQTEAFNNRLNPLLDQLSAEGLTVPYQVSQVFNLQPATVAYTLGASGTFQTSGGLRALKATAWRAFYAGVLHSGGRVLSLAEFGEQAKQILGEQSAIPGIVGADTAYPNLNVRVFPPPSSPAGSIELVYLTPLLNFFAVGDTINLPQGWILLLRSYLARDLFPQYGRPSTKDVVWDNAARARMALLTENAMTAPQPQPAAPQGQQ